VTLEIVPLNCGYITEVERSAHQYFHAFGEKVCAQSVLWLIRGGEFPIVVDVGAGTTELVQDRFGRELKQTARQTPREAVADAGVDPDDVGLVVQTHLHWDHALGLELNPFPNADIHIQRRELRYAASPYPVHAGLYDPRVIKKLLPTQNCEYPRIKVIDGDRKISDNVQILLTPGHTPGTQSLLVDTGSVVYAIASDNVPFESSWSGNYMADWIPSGIHVSLKDCYESMSRLADLADVVLPSHDPCVFDWGPLPPDGARPSASN
jgi:N-acyl homoserine lactone hydrolase